MRPITELPVETCRGLRGVFTDIDDTLTWEGKLVPEAFVAMADLQRAGLRVIPITGRPGGWVDQIARMWP
ncbi:MAG: HAD family hydrolase, partial [Deltaproteobacteria bacterium]|nr:HAD family hydrolase [Deltaproteobacteria bacterium]